MRSPKAYWKAAMDFVPTDVQLDRACRCWKQAAFWLRVAIIALITFEACQIVPAFFPGSTVDRMFGGK